MSLPVEKLDEVERLLTDLESVEEKLRALQDGLTQSHRLATLGTMASIICHELNNLLTPIISYCQLAQSAPTDIELLKKAVDRSLKGALKAAQISSSMLGFARENDEAQDALIRFVVDEVFHCLARAPEKDGITLTIDVPKDLRAAIPPVNLQQVLLNLVLNARQAMRARGGKLTVRAEQRGAQVIIEVIDTGRGIPADIRGREFEPFVTRRDPSCNEGRGTGLGLAVCRDLIRRAGGTIEIASTSERGTTFRITLPIKR
jgi:signal transduction histidine kinase